MYIQPTIDKHVFPHLALLQWYDADHRQLPWRQTTNPYIVWISEIVLQQTRVDQGLGYFKRLVERFPTVQDLAMAQESEVLKFWEGLGYYSRARNLHQTAKVVAFEMEGKFPSTYAELLKLKGIGPYTAAAIASISFNQSVAAVDGNVIRVLARYHAIYGDPKKPDVRKAIDTVAGWAVDSHRPGDHNQAMMELGATVCTPRDPKCQSCPLRQSCAAFAQNLQALFPERSAKTVVKDRHIGYFFLVDANGDTLVRTRTGNDIWKGLNEFPNIDQDGPFDVESLLDLGQSMGFIIENAVIVGAVVSGKHLLSHRLVHYHIVRVLGTLPVIEGYKVVGCSELTDLAFPRPVRRYLDGLTAQD